MGRVSFIIVFVFLFVFVISISIFISLFVVTDAAAAAVAASVVDVIGKTVWIMSFIDIGIGNNFNDNGNNPMIFNDNKKERIDIKTRVTADDFDASPFQFPFFIVLLFLILQKRLQGESLQGESLQWESWQVLIGQDSRMSQCRNAVWCLIFALSRWLVLALKARLEG
jgi:hypothetical protein